MPVLFEKIDQMTARSRNQYALALAIAKRVRRLRSGAPPLVTDSDPRRRPFETAMREIGEGKVTFRAEEPDTD